MTDSDTRRLVRTVAVFDDREKAEDLISDLPKILRKLGLGDRFSTEWAPHPVKDRQRRGRATRVECTYYGVRIRDKDPGAELPEIISSDIATVWREVQMDDEEQARRAREALDAPPGNGDQVSAFGRTQTLLEWARLFRTKPSYVREVLKHYENVEEALSAIALNRKQSA